jgi:hypothetical protein
MAANGISTLPTKQQKQIAKLNLASYNLQQEGNIRCGYDITELPTQYTGNAQSLLDNPNTGGLVLGRPWVALTSGGVNQYSYSGYWNEDVTYMPTNTALSSKVATTFTISSEANYKSEWLIGYILANYTGTWTFSMAADDYGLLWIGPNARSGYTTSNALIVADVSTVTATINLTAGSYYPLMIMYGNGGGAGYLRLQYSHTGQSLIDVPSSMLFYNPNTNGI